MTASELADALAARAADVARLLLPNGTKKGKEWTAGSVEGEAGKSLSLCISGDKKGTWKDFATGEGGDLLDLWMAVRKVGIVEAMEQARKWLGIADDRGLRQGRHYKRPPKPQCRRPAGPVSTWLASRGLTEQTVAAFRIGERAEGDRTYAVFPYIRDGEFVNAKLRNVSDKRDMRQLAGAEPCLFGWHLIDDRCRKVVITEGEIDCMTLHQMGIAALSCNAGAGNHQWIESDYHRLDRFDEIVVAYDADEAGQKGAAEIARRLGEGRVRIASFAPYKDANEALMDGRDHEFFRRAIDSATHLDVDGIRSIADYEDDALRLFYPDGGSDGYQLEIADRRYDWVVFRPSEVSVWTGINGHGKSMFLAQLAVQQSSVGAKWCVYSGEMAPALQLKRLAKLAGGVDRPTPEYLHAISQWLADKIWVISRVGSVELGWLLETFEYAVRRYGCDCFLVDSLMMLSDVPEDGHGALSAQKAAIQKVADFAKRFGVHVHIVAHPRKGRDEKEAPGKLDVGGSSRITDGADNVFSVWNAKNDPEKEDYNPDDPDGYITIHKQRNGDVQERAIAIWSIPGCRQFAVSPRRRPITFVDYSCAGHVTTHAGIDTAASTTCDAPTALPAW